MDFNDYVRVPFVVEAVEVTVDNIAEIAPQVGTLQYKSDGTPFIQVDKTKVPNVYRVYPGFYMTRMGDNIRCYARRVFREQFVRMTTDTQEAVDTITQAVPKPPSHPRRSRSEVLPSAPTTDIEAWPSQATEPLLPPMVD